MATHNRKIGKHGNDNGSFVRSLQSRCENVRTIYTTAAIIAKVVKTIAATGA